MVATLKATTIDRVKAAGLGSFDINSDDYDDFLMGLIEETSVQFETYLGHKLLKSARTEVQDVEKFQRTFFLREYPITSVSTVKVRSAISTDWASVSALTATTYSVDTVTGRLYLDTSTAYEGHDAIQVVYTAGFSTTTALLITEYPEIASAAERQVAYLFRRRNELEASTHSVGGGTSSQVGAAKMLPGVMETLRPYRRMVL
jgi:hypothetical protein